MRNLALTFSLVASLSVGVSCKKEDSNKAKPSGALSSSEKGLLANLPGDANVIFGGKAGKFVDYWKNSPLKDLAEGFTGKMGGGDKMAGYMDCWMDYAKDMEMVGTFAIDGKEGTMRMLFSGVEKSSYEKCAEKGGMTVKADADGKYLEVQGIPDGQGGTRNIGYYFVSDKVSYLSIKTPLGGGTVGAPATRADLEADIKKAEASPASSDAKLKPLLEKADRSKSIWFAGSAEGTPAAKDMKSAVGWIDASSDAITVGFSVEFNSDEMPTQAVEGFEQAKGQIGMLDMMGPGLKDAAEEFLKDFHLDADGSTLNGRFKLANSVLNKVIPMAKGQLGL